MSLFKLAYSNFKRSVKNYVALIISLSFSIFTFFNFQNIIFSNAMDVLKEKNSDYITIIIEVISIVLVIFLFFFIWYATNVFLSQRKKDIGIFTFMGLDNTKIGKMYMIEIAMIGILALILGLGSGVIFSKLFTMVLLRVSDISIDVAFNFSIVPIVLTIILFLGIFVIMIIKGYINILKSSVLDMLSATKQNELKQESGIFSLFKVIIGIILISGGYYCALLVGDMTSFIYTLYAVVLVITGIYFLYNGVIPFTIRKLSQNKNYLYKKERSLWINNLAFRLKKNYRAYAMVTILMICSVTILATSFAMKQRYDNISHFRSTYSYTIMSNKMLDDKKITQEIGKTNSINYYNSLNYIALNSEIIKSKYTYNQYGVVSYSQLKNAAKKAKIKFNLPQLNGKQVVMLTKLYLLDISNPENNPIIEIAGEKYQIVEETDISYLGLLQENISTYVVSDKIYEDLKVFGQEYYTYNYQIKDPNNYQASLEYLNSIVKEEPTNYVGYLANDPNGGDIAWVRMLYSICIFLFLVFILASASVIFMKLSNEAFEDKERYIILNKLGISKVTLIRAIKNELRFAYYCPFVLMSVSSYFSIHALANVMKTELITINIISVVFILGIFTIIYIISVITFNKRVLGDC